jgi:hypothetical protein
MNGEVNGFERCGKPVWSESAVARAAQHDLCEEPDETMCPHSTEGARS